VSKRRRRRKGGNGNSREALRARARKQWQDRKIAARMRAGLRRQANSPSGRAQRREQALALWGDPDYRARMLAIATGPAGRAQRSKQSRAAWADPDYAANNAEKRSANRRGLHNVPRESSGSEHYPRSRKTRQRASNWLESGHQRACAVAMWRSGTSTGRARQQRGVSAHKRPATAV